MSPFTNVWHAMRLWDIMRVLRERTSLVFVAAQAKRVKPAAKSAAAA